MTSTLTLTEAKSAVERAALGLWDEENASSCAPDAFSAKQSGSDMEPVGPQLGPVTGPGSSPEVGARWRDAAIRAALDLAMNAGAAERVLALAVNYDQLVSMRLQSDGGQAHLVPAVDGERRRRGSFATPPSLAAELARRVITGGTQSVLDPACGAGALLRAALARLLTEGVPPEVALTRLHGVDTDPLAVDLCRASLAAQAGVGQRLFSGGEVVGPRIVVGDALFSPVWTDSFADLLDQREGPVDPATGWRGGFDAVVANPPWERLKVFRSEGTQAVATMRGPRAQAARSLRDQGRHPLTGNGELNTYLPFVETCWRLLAPGGRASILVPAGIAADRSAAPLMAALLETDSLESVHLLTAGRGVFPGVSSRVGVGLVDLRWGSPQLGVAARARQVRRGAAVCIDVDDPAAVDPQQVWQLDAAFAALVNPNTHTIPTCASARDAELLGRAHQRWPVLVRHDPPQNPWQVRLVTPLHMTRDAGHFKDAPGPGLLPLWEAKQAGLLDHEGGASPAPRYWVDADVVRARFGSLADRGWLGAYRNVTTVDSPRTLLPCALPFVAVGNSLPLIDAPRLPLLLSVLAALPIDHLVRQRHAGANLNFFKLEQTALPSPAELDRPHPWTNGAALSQWLLIRFAAAQRWSPELAALGVELRANGVDVAVARESMTRAQALVEIDVAIALLLGYDADDIEHLLAAFPGLRRTEERQLGEFRTGRLLRVTYQRLTAGMTSPDV